ncbi:MAG: Transcription factor rfx3, variant 2 [Marteilia pararefringens]
MKSLYSGTRISNINHHHNNNNQSATFRPVSSPSASMMRYSSAYCTNSMMTDTTSYNSSSNNSSMVIRRSFSSSKAPSQTLKWLMDNFEGAEGVSLPRATLFALYMQHCNENHVEPMNAASFGKMIRSIFSGLKTRRLGTRGNSKYHYYGIKLKQQSILQRRLEEVSHQIKPLGSLEHLEKRQRCTSQKHLMSVKSLKNTHLSSSLPKKPREEQKKDSESLKNSSNPNSVRCFMKIPSLPAIQYDKAHIKSLDLESEHFAEFYGLYVEHFEASIAAINNAQFEYISSIWNAFWRHPSFDANNSSFRMIEKRLPTDMFFKLCEEPIIIDFVYKSDNIFFDSYAEYIFPSVITTIDDSTLVNLRNGTTILPNIITKSTIHLPMAIVSAKCQAKDNFLSYIKDIVSISQSTGAVKNIFRSKTCLNQIVKDFESLDFEEINNRLFELFPLRFGNIQTFRDIINAFLTNKCENISNDTIVDDLLMNLISHIDMILSSSQTDDFVKSLRQLYVQWCLFSSMILRELTLQSSPSFGVFQVLRTLLDDFLMHNIKIAIAKLSDSPVLSALRDISNLEQQLS